MFTDYFQVWLNGFWNPVRFATGLKGKPAPLWGVCGQVLRSCMDALLLYLPLAYMGKTPSTTSYITFLPTQSYFFSMIWLAPIFLIMQWLLLCACLHVTLRLSGSQSDIDQIMNVTGMVALVVGSFLVLWDWIWVAFGWDNTIILGISHIVFDIWAILLTTVGFKHLLKIPIWKGILLNLIWLALGLPLSILFMRAPI